MVLEHGHGDEAAELWGDERRGREGRVEGDAHILLNIFLTGSYCALAELHAKGCSGIIETPGGEVDMWCGVDLALKVRLLGLGMELVGGRVGRR